MWKIIIHPLLLVLAVSGSPVLRAADEQAGDNGEPSLRLITAMYQEIATEYTTDAVIEAVNQSTISAQTAGQVVEINFDVDDYVKEGEVLLRIKNTEQKAGVARVQAQLGEARARYREAQTEHNRVKEAYEKQALPKADMDRAEANLEAARARLAAAQAAMKESGQQLDYTEVRAPYSGLVNQRHIELGEVAGIGQPLMSGFSLDQLRALANVPQNLIGEVREHQQARIIVEDSRGRQSIPAGEITILPYANTQGHTFKVRVRLPDKTEGLYPGMFVKAAFVTGKDKRLVLPVETIAYRGEVRAVYVMDQGRIVMRQVRLGERFDSGMVEVLAGLEEGEQVALDPVRASVELKKQRAPKPSHGVFSQWFKVAG